MKPWRIHRKSFAAWLLAGYGVYFLFLVGKSRQKQTMDHRRRVKE